MIIEMKLKLKNPSAKFLAYVIKPADPEACWGWINKVEPKSYPKFWIGTSASRKMYLAHRFSYEINYGPIPKGLQVLHRCDNTHCSNPRHLFLGTNLDNVKDRNQKNRQTQKENHPSFKLGFEKATKIRETYKTGNFSQRELAKMYSVTHTSIGKILRNERWVGA